MVTSENPGLEKRANKTQVTSCFLHQFLEKQRKHGKSKLASMTDVGDDQKQDKAPLGHNGANSRLLTKRQLLEMAGEIRDLSKRLGNLRLKLHVKTVFLLTKAHDETLIEKTRDVVEWLLSKERDTPYIVYASSLWFSREELIEASYVENTLEHNNIFDAQALVSVDSSREGRLKYWDNDLCAKHPHTFDFAVTVRSYPLLRFKSDSCSSEVMVPFSTQAGCSNGSSHQFYRYR